jgi:hypothetical protein
VAIELRHTEKNILFKLLSCESFGDVEVVILNLIATMEPEDVEQVKKQVTELKNLNKG